MLCIEVESCVANQSLVGAKLCHMLVLGEGGGEGPNSVLSRGSLTGKLYI